MVWSGLQHFEIFVFLSFILSFLVLLILMLSFLNKNFQKSQAKISSYECGFEPFGDARTRFDVQFYLLGILFLVFDLEIIFLYPWLYSLIFRGVLFEQSLLTLFLFLLILTLGFIYEWGVKALEWTPRFQKGVL